MFTKKTSVTLYGYLYFTHSCLNTKYLNCQLLLNFVIFNALFQNTLRVQIPQHCIVISYNIVKFIIMIKHKTVKDMLERTVK